VGRLSGTFAASSRLLALAKARESLERRRNPLSPLIHLLANMFLCAFSNRYLADDPGGAYLPLFIAVQCLLPVAITLSFVAGTGAEIVRKTRVLPGSLRAGRYFLLAASLRRREFLLFAVVGCLFPALVYGGSATQVVGVVTASALAVLTMQAVCCAAAARLIASERPLAGLALATAVVTVAASASVFVFSTSALASSVPLAGWAASSIAAFAAGRVSEGYAGLVPLALSAAAVLYFFRK